MEFALIAFALGIGFALRRLFTRPRPVLEVALEHLARGAPVRAEHVAERAVRAARRPADRARARLVLARVLVETGELRRAAATLDEAMPVLREAGDEAAHAEAAAMRARIDEARAAGPAGDVDAVFDVAPEAPSTDEPAIADRCGGGGCGGCRVDGELQPDASRAFAGLLQQGGAAGLVRAAEIRRDGDRLVPRVTLAGNLTPEQERTVEQAVRGAMSALFR
jgi:hypothetical protein